MYKSRSRGIAFTNFLGSYKMVSFTNGCFDGLRYDVTSTVWYRDRIKPIEFECCNIVQEGTSAPEENFLCVFVGSGYLRPSKIIKPLIIKKRGHIASLFCVNSYFEAKRNC
jgi:hypothetical protein